MTITAPDTSDADPDHNLTNIKTLIVLVFSDEWGVLMTIENRRWLFQFNCWWIFKQYHVWTGDTTNIMFLYSCYHQCLVLDFLQVNFTRHHRILPGWCWSRVLWESSLSAEFSTSCPSSSLLFSLSSGDEHSKYKQPELICCCCSVKLLYFYYSSQILTDLK